MFSLNCMKIFDINLCVSGQVDDEFVGIRQSLKFGQISDLARNTQIGPNLAKNAKIW